MKFDFLTNARQLFPIKANKKSKRPVHNDLYLLARSELKGTEMTGTRTTYSITLHPDIGVVSHDSIGYMPEIRVAALK